MFLEIDRDCVVGEEENKVKHNFVPQKKKSNKLVIFTAHDVVLTESGCVPI